MIKSSLVLSIAGTLLALLQGGLSIYFPAFASKIYIVSHFVFFMLTLSAVFSVVVISKLTKVLPAFIFLGQSLVKIIFAGAFFIFALRFLEKIQQKDFLIFFVAFYFAYMIIELIIVMNWLKKEA